MASDTTLAPPLEPRTHEHHGGARQHATHLPVRTLAEPAVAAVGSLPCRRLVGATRVEGAAQMMDADARVRRHMAQGQRRAKGILLLAQVADHRHFEHVAQRRSACNRWRRLMDHTRLCPQPGRQFRQSFFLQQHQTRGESRRCLCTVIRADVAVEIGAREGYDRAPARMACGIARDGRMALVCMQRQQGIDGGAILARLLGHAMPFGTQHARLAHRRLSIAVAGLPPRGRHQGDLHLQALG